MSTRGSTGRGTFSLGVTLPGILSAVHMIMLYVLHVLLFKGCYQWEDLAFDYIITAFTSRTKYAYYMAMWLAIGESPRSVWPGQSSSLIPRALAVLVR